MKQKFVDCFMLMGTALSLQRGDQTLPEMGRPVLQDVFTTVVNVSITLQEVHFISATNMEVQFTFLLHERWTDPRLGPNSHTKRLAVNGQIWRPWITSTEGELRGIENDITQYWRGVAPEGNILYSQKLILKTFCTSDFVKFPFDTQKCAIKLGSYRFPKDEVKLIWNKLPVEILTGDNWKEFKLIDVITSSEVEIRPSGSFSVLVVQISIRRFFEHYFFCIFIPCIVAVLISYITFWIHPSNIKIRYFISISNLFLLLYIYHYSICSTIAVTYMKALDLFVSFCTCFVFITVLENLIIDMTFRTEDYEEYGSRFFHKIKPSYNVKYKVLDRIACMIFPILFICVNLFYCMMYVL